MKQLALILAVMSCVGAWQFSRAETLSTLAEKLAPINVRIDGKALAGSYLSYPDAGKVVPGSLAGFSNKVSGATVVISGLDIAAGGGADFVNDEATKKEMERRAKAILERVPKAKVLGMSPKAVNGYVYWAIKYLVTEGEVGDRSLTKYFTQYVTQRDGWSLSVLSIAKYPREADNAAEDVLQALWPLHEPGTTHVGTFDDYKGQIHGFATHLKKDGWMNWARADDLFPSNFVAAQKNSKAFVAVVVIPLPCPSVSFEDNFVAVMRNCSRFGEPEKYFTVKEDKRKGFDHAVKFGANVPSKDPSVGAQTYVGGWFGQGTERLMLVMAWSTAQEGEAGKKLVESALAGVEPLEIPKAPALSTFSTRQRQYQCNVLADIAGQLLRRGRNEDAAQAFCAAFDCFHADISVLEMAVTSMQQIGDFKRADLVLDRYWTSFKDSPRAWLLRAGLRRAAGDKEKAMEDYAAAFNAGLSDENSVLLYMALMWETGRLKEALSFISQYEKNHSSSRVLRWHAATLARMKEFDRASAIYDKLIKASPFDQEAVFQYGEYANQAGKPETALAMAQRLINEHFDTPRTRLLEGWAHYGKKEWREAKVSFELARKASPNDPAVMEALNTANSALGEGDSSMVKQPIEALVLPAEVQKRTEAAIASFKHDEDESAVNLVHTMQMRFQKNQPFVYTMHRKIKVLDNSGVDALSTLDIPFDPLAERVFVNQVSVLDEDGKVVAQGKTDDQYVTDPSMNGPATLGRVLRVPVPGLKPGRILDYVWTKSTLDPEKAMWFKTEWIGSTYPSASQAVVVEGDLTEIQAEANDSLKKAAQMIEDKGGKTRTWFVPSVPQLHTEPFLPRLSTFTPVLWLGAPGGDWAKVGQDYLELIQEPLKPDPEIEALAKKLTAGSASEHEKIDRLSRYVREEITYKAIEFGRRARIPNRPSRVVANHYGDCKDMALLLHHLLKAVGIESHLTLISTNADLAEGLPDLDQFNHMILHVPSLKAQFVDCTEGKSAGIDLPPSLFDLKGLVLDTAKPKVMEMPKRSQWPASRLVAHREVRFDSEGSADVTDSLEFTGYLAQGMRMFLNSTPPPRRLDSMQAWLQRASHWQLEKMEFNNLVTPSLPLVLSLRYSIPPPVQPGTHLVQIPSVLETEYLEVAYLRHRHNPYEQIHPMEIESEVHVVGTSPLDPGSLQAITRSNGKARCCSWSMLAKPEPGASNECRLSFNAAWAASAGAAEEYGVMRNEVAAAASGWAVPLRFVEEAKTAGK